METFIDLILPIIGTLFTALATWGINELVKWLKSKTTDARISNALSTFDNLASIVVKEVSQTYVDSMKKGGSFDTEAQHEAFVMAYDKIVNLMTNDQAAAISSICNDFEQYLTALIESKVKG